MFFIFLLHNFLFLSFSHAPLPALRAHSLWLSLLLVYREKMLRRGAQKLVYIREKKVFSYVCEKIKDALALEHTHTTQTHSLDICMGI